MAGLWLDNWRGLRNSALIGGAVAADGKCTAYTTGGQLAYLPSGSFTSPCAARIANSRSTSASGYLTVRFGTSNTAPTQTDRDLGSPITSNLSYVAASVNTGSWSGNTYTRDYTVTIQNTATASVTIREYGLFVPAQYGNGSNGDVMLYREVLDSPVTVGQYESATINFSVSMTLGDPV